MTLIRWMPILLAATLSTGHAQTPTASAARDPLLRALLITRASMDQRQMQALAEHWTDSAYHRRLAATLRENAVWLDSIVKDRGWPGFSVADSDGTSSAFLIAQHADSTPAEQRRLLSALRIAVAANDAPRMDLAYLEDRIRKADGKPQLYGTQPAYDKRGDAVQPEVESPDSLDIRRKAVGLMPMAAYLKQMRATNARLRAAQRRAAETRPAFADSTRRP